MRWPRILRSRRWLILPPILLGVAIVAALAASRKELNRIEVSESALPVDIITVASVPMHPQVVAYGSAEPNRRWMAVAEVGGRVDATRANLESGVPVHKGELLLSIDRADYQLRLEQREADLRQAKSQLVQLKLNKESDTASLTIQRDLLSVRSSEVTRLQTLQDRSAASKSELDAARAAMLQQKQSVQTLLNSLSTYDAQIETAEAAIALSESRAKEAQRDVDRTQIFCPFNGLLFGVDLEQGQYVAPGQTLFEVIDTSWVEVEAQVAMAEWSRMLRLMKECTPPTTLASTEAAMLTTPRGGNGYESTANPDPSLLGLTALLTIRNGEQHQHFIGTPIRLTSSLDQQTRTIGIVVRVDNPLASSGLVDRARPHLRPGTYCEISLRSESFIPAFRVPRNSIEDGAVLCVGSDGRLQRRQVSVAFALEEHVAVTGGLSEGDRVVVNPPALVLDGQLAEPISNTDVQARSSGDVSTP